MWFLLGSILTAVIICAVRGLLWLIGFVIMFPFAVIKQIIRIMGGRQENAAAGTSSWKTKRPPA